MNFFQLVGEIAIASIIPLLIYIISISDIKSKIKRKTRINEYEQSRPSKKVFNARRDFIIDNQKIPTKIVCSTKWLDSYVRDVSYYYYDKGEFHKDYQASLIERRLLYIEKTLLLEDMEVYIDETEPEFKLL